MNKELKIKIECFNKTNVTRYKLFVQWKLFQNFFWPSFPTSILYRDSLRRSTFCLDLTVDSANWALNPHSSRNVLETPQDGSCAIHVNPDFVKEQNRRICEILRCVCNVHMLARDVFDVAK